MKVRLNKVLRFLSNTKRKGAKYCHLVCFIQRRDTETRMNSAPTKRNRSSSLVMSMGLTNVSMESFFLFMYTIVLW